MNASDYPTILVTIDGLRAAALGAYGQTAYETPAFDGLAAESLAFDWCYAPAADRHVVLNAIASATSDARRVTDDPDWVRPGGDDVLVSALACEGSAPSIAETFTAGVWSDFAHALSEANPSDSTIWFHATGMHSVWDAPARLWAPLVDEEDTPVEAGVAPPVADFDDPQSEAACDARFSAGCRYAAEVLTLDACLAAWLEVFDAVFEGRDARLILAGLRGYALGEHGRIGPDDRLFSESQHVPLFLRDPAPSRRFCRDQRPITLPAAIRPTLASASPDAAPRLESAAAQAIITSKWMLRRPHDGEPELYVKPDDRWEQNDVASLEERVAAEMLAELARPAAGVGSEGNSG